MSATKETELMEENKESTNVGLNCDELLQFATKIVQDHNHGLDNFFGHPQPPKLQLVTLRSSTTAAHPQSDLFLVLSKTPKSICGQAVAVVRGGDGEQEQRPITEPQLLFSLNEPGQEDTTIRTHTTISCTVQDDVNNNNPPSVVLLVGTNTCQLVCCTILLHMSEEGEYDKDRTRSDSPSAVMELTEPAYPIPLTHQTQTDPTGGVVYLGQHTSKLFVAYGDGTCLQIPTTELIQLSKEQQQNSSDIVIPAHKITKAQLVLESQSEAATFWNIVPCWNHHQSPILFDDDNDNDEENNTPSGFSALVYPAHHSAGGAPGGFGDGFPTLTMYTSDDQFAGQRLLHDDDDDPDDTNHDSELLHAAIGATSNIVKGIAGVVSWGFGGGSGRRRKPEQHNHAEDRTKRQRDEDNIPHEDPSSSVFSARPHAWLYPGSEFHDAPRQIMSLSIDPMRGNLAAMTDNLGRVLLMDLETCLVIRLWKGVRDAECHWMPHQHLLIHSHQRRVVEIWNLRSGGNGERVMSRSVHRDAQIVPWWTVVAPNGELELTCSLLPSSAAGSQQTTLEDLSTFLAIPPTSEEDELVSLVTTGGDTQDGDQSVKSLRSTLANSCGNSVASLVSPPRPSQTALQLQTLQQMLATTHVEYEKEDVLQTFKLINGLSDLASALDVLSTASSLETRLEIEGSGFMVLALRHARWVWDKATKHQGADVLESKPVTTLYERIRYHQQLVDSYTVLHKFEKKEQKRRKKRKEEQQQEKEQKKEQDEKEKPATTWILEATSWISTYETATGRSLDEDRVPPAEFMAYTEFAKRVTTAEHVKPSEGEGWRKTSAPFGIYFSDSSKTRKEVLGHVFCPLRADVFSYAVVNEILTKLGIIDDFGYVQRCFGEWMMGTALEQIQHAAFVELQSPMKRWVQDMVGRDVDKLLQTMSEEQETKTTEEEAEEEENATPQKPVLVLKALYEFVQESSDLVRAFVLGTICREAISVVVKKREIKTYGRVWTSEAVQPWDQLLRKLRVCLLVGLRLNGMPLGSFPITVKHVDDPEIFSIHEWVARDELAMSFYHEEIVTLENATALSGVVLDPLNHANDAQWQLIQQACLNTAVSDQERAEYLVGMEVNLQGALLLYLSNHNNPTILVAHRALLIAQMWLEVPDRLDLMRHCIDALFALEESSVLAGAVRLEVWQTCIRPVYRALLFGFEDVPEIQHSVYEPLLETPDWLHGLGKAGLSILTLISRVDWDLPRTLELPNDTSGGWPPVREDLILSRIISQSRRTHQSAIDIHRVVVAGCVVSTDFETLSHCVTGFYECFDNHSLFEASVSPDGDGAKQLDFLERSIIERAQAFQRPILERFDIDEIETLSLLWSIDVRDVRTIFLLAMYELAKDPAVDDMLTKVSSQRGMDLERFIEDGLGIACHRLNYILNVKRTPKMRRVLGMLDADTCEWIREQAETTASLLDSDGATDQMVLEVPIQLTHIFVMRLLSLASATGAEKETRLKIHSISVLSGTIQNEFGQGQ